MSKKKIISIVAACVLLIAAIGSATMAYFTDTDQKLNNFTVGDIDIEVTETVGVTDKDGETVTGGATTDNKGNTTYNNIMPSYSMKKTAVVKNKSANDAYVRVFVTMNNFVAINDALDAVYESQGETVVQGMYDTVFDGFGIQHGKDVTKPEKCLRGWLKRDLTDGKLLAVDYVRAPANNYQWVKNTFMTEFEGTDQTNSTNDKTKGYYGKALTKDSRTYVFYLKLKAGESYTLFNGLKAPAEFNNEQMKMFDGLKIGVYADAIQTIGFDDWKSAIVELNKVHELGWWNS